MIKKVSSWVLGSFFRQFGRFLFFLVLGGLVFLLIQHNDINFKWTDLLGIETIKAVELSSDEMLNRFTQDCSYRIDGGENVGNTTCGWNNNFRTASITTASGSGMGTVHFTSSNWTVPRLGLPTTNGYSYSLLPYKVQFQVRIDYSSLWSFYQQFQEYEPVTGSSVTESWVTRNGISFNFFPVYGDGDNPTAVGGLCETNYSNNDGAVAYYTITCNVPSIAYNITDLRMMYSYNVPIDGYSSSPTSIGISTNFNFLFTGILEARQYLQDMQNNNSINTIVTQQNETISIISDTNTTSETNETTSFFNSTHSSSEGILSSIVSAPLTLLNNLASGTYNDICATLNGKNICLPSGGIIWNRDHTAGTWFRGGTTQAFIDFFNLVVGGFVLYKCLASLFYSVHTLLDPTKTWVEVMKL